MEPDDVSEALTGVVAPPVLLNDAAVLALRDADEVLAALEVVLLDDLVDDPPARMEALAALLVAMADYRRQWQTLENGIEQVLVTLVPPGEAPEVPGLGVLQVRRTGTRVRYDNEMLTAALAARVADEVVDRTTGEVPPLGVVAEHVARAVAEATGALAPSFSGWRKGAALAHGLTVDDYETERVLGRLTVKVER